MANQSAALEREKQKVKSVPFADCKGSDPCNPRDERAKKPPSLPKELYSPPPRPGEGGGGIDEGPSGEGSAGATSSGDDSCPPFCGPDGGGGGSMLSSPTRVGGVYLSGAGKLLDGFGQLEGVALDANNNLVLIGKEGNEVGLPPLRLDDVVTVFRSVYLHDEGPTVTIDPNPEKPYESAMIIRHGKATENTYVGWVLYQADRLMKGYTLGRDNITTQEVKSHDLHYETDILKTIYFGAETPEQLRQHGRWERFWIVPGDLNNPYRHQVSPGLDTDCPRRPETLSAVTRFESSKKQLTLFDVPLKVNSQPMKWAHGKLIDDCRATPSPGATVFSRWFSQEYDLIAKEQFLTPPAESGITTPVPVFTELRRVALITAIAEKLRDQGIPLPFWMRDYDVRPMPFERFTPALRMQKPNPNGTLIAHIFGGVNLSPPDKVVHTFIPASDLGKLSHNEQVAIKERLALADSLVKPVHREMSFAEPASVRHFSQGGTQFHAVSLPGNDTQALASARLEEVDLSVPIEGGRSIQLRRSFNSFFEPNGPWGKSWALDLPELVEVLRPVSRGTNEATYQMTYELVTPLNAVYAHFSKVAEVPALNHSRLLVSDPANEFLGLADDRPKFLSAQTRKVFLKDGRAWHFTKAGGAGRD